MVVKTVNSHLSQLIEIIATSDSLADQNMLIQPDIVEEDKLVSEFSN